MLQKMRAAQQERTRPRRSRARERERENMVRERRDYKKLVTNAETCTISS